MLIFSYIYRKLRKKCKITEVKQESNCMSDNEIRLEDKNIKNDIKRKICDMRILGQYEIDNIQKLSYISILELLLLIIRCNNYMIEYLINDENQK
jgi:hypothetical protein